MMQHRLIAEEVCRKLSDREIVEKSLENLDYFTCLYHRYGPRLLRYIRRISSTGDQEAQDILQDALIKAWRNLNAYQPDLKLSSWLYRIVHNETISHWRKTRFHDKELTLTIHPETDRAFREDVSLTGDTSDPFQEIQEVLSRMPAKYRDVLTLKFLESMSYEEISDILKIPEGTVAARINRAKKVFIKLAGKTRLEQD